MLFRVYNLGIHFPYNCDVIFRIVMFHAKRMKHDRLCHLDILTIIVFG